MDEIPFPRLDSIIPDPDAIGILPGSRRKELAALLAEFGEAGRQLKRFRPELKLSVIRAPSVDPETIRAGWPADVPMTLVEPEDRYEAMRRASFLIAASGTVSLESALIGTPTVVAYRLSKLTFALARRVIDVKYISLPNLILDEQVFPELLQEQAGADTIAASYNFV